MALIVAFLVLLAVYASVAPVVQEVIGGWFTLSAMVMALGTFLIWRGSFWQRMLPATLIHLA